jgi:hypothetical protein
MGSEYSTTANGGFASSYYGYTSDGQAINSDSFDKTGYGDIYKSTDTFTTNGLYGLDYTSTYSATGADIAHSTSYYSANADGTYTNDYFSKTSSGGTYSQTDSGNYGGYYLYNGYDPISDTVKSVSTTADGAVSASSNIYSSTVYGDYSNTSSSSYSGGDTYKSTDTGNYGAYTFNGYYDSGWAYGNYTNKSETLSSTGAVIYSSTSYHNAAVDGQYTTDFQSSTSGGGIYKQTNSGWYGSWNLYNGTDPASYTDKSAYFDSSGVKTSGYTDSYSSTALGNYSSISTDTTGAYTYNTTDTGNYGGYTAYDYGVYSNTGWNYNDYTDKSSTYDGASLVAQSTSYYNLSASTGVYTSDYYSNTANGSYHTTDVGNIGEYGGHQSYYLDKNASYSASGTLEGKSTTYYTCTATSTGDIWSYDYQYTGSNGSVYHSTETGNYTTGYSKTTDMYINSAGKTTGTYTTTTG